jgi:hypothetical protein
MDSNTLTPSDIKKHMLENPILFAKLCANKYRIIEGIVIALINNTVYITTLNANTVFNINIDSEIHYTSFEPGFTERFDITVKELFTMAATNTNVELLKKATNLN